MIGSAVKILASEVFDGKEEKFLAVGQQLNALTRYRAYTELESSPPLSL